MKWDRTAVRIAVIVVLAGAYCAFAAFRPYGLESKSLYSPLAYLALVLCAMWWGRKGVVLAALFAVIGFLPRFWQADVPDAWGDAARTVSFFVVALGL
ncbi:MAG: hypothetical protein JXR94_17045, partial [Candidatus Hydrogenedentes bacterium]|nr:hypothetical protein [Candidatus Hydrogenedentota bacterium]